MNHSNNIFEEILNTRSMTVIEYRIEDELPNMDEGPAKETLLKMQKTNDLDEVWALAHESLGHHEKAAELREWIAGKETRKKNQPQYPL